MGLKSHDHLEEIFASHRNLLRTQFDTRRSREIEDYPAVFEGLADALREQMESLARQRAAQLASRSCHRVIAAELRGAGMFSVLARYVARNFVKEHLKKFPQPSAAMMPPDFNRGG